MDSMNTLKTWVREAKKAGTLSLQTGNHHLLLYLKTKGTKEWIVLLGKRRPHFPFYGTRFENATFYDLKERKLFHASAEELTNLVFRRGDLWEISGSEPSSFRLCLRPSFLRRRKIFLKKIFPFSTRHVPGALFRYHLLDCSSPFGVIGQDPIAWGHGVSEEGALSILTPKDWQVPFTYTLLVNLSGKGGSLHWRADWTKPQNLAEKIPNFIKKTFLKDHFQWGDLPLFAEAVQLKTLAVTSIPLGDYRLKREIVLGEEQNTPKVFGLRESFVKIG